MSTGDIESSRLALEQAFGQMRTGIDTCVDNFNRIVGGVNHWAWLLGPIPMYFIKNHLDDLRDALHDGIEVAEKVLRSGVPVLSLFTTSIDYLNAAQAPVSDIAFDISTPRDDNLHYWSGAASAAYQQKQGAQRSAADKAAENATVISKWLFDVGKTNVAYAVEIVQMLVDAGAELVNVVVDAASVIDLQFSLDHLAEAVRKLITAAVNQLVGLANKFVATLGDCRELLARRNDHGAFADGRWPQAVYG
jgi:hypothetical protein